MRLLKTGTVLLDQPSLSKVDLRTEVDKIFLKKFMRSCSRGG